MKARRRGVAAGVVEAKAGTMASSKGREMTVPRPRRIARRERCFSGERTTACRWARLGKLVSVIGLRHLLELLTRHDCFDELGEGLVTANRSHGQFAAERVGEELGAQASGESVLILEQDLLEAFGAFKSLPV